MTDEEIAFGNIWAKCQVLGLSQYILETRLKLKDRVYFMAERDLTRVLIRDTRFQRSEPVSGAHAKIYGVFKSVFVGAVGSILPKLYSYREIGRPSLQVTYFVHGSSCYGDMDIDLSSPLMDVVGFFIHLIEVLTPGITNHRKLRKKLAKNPELEKYLA